MNYNLSDQENEQVDLLLDEIDRLKELQALYKQRNNQKGVLLAYRQENTVQAQLWALYDIDIDGVKT